MRVPGNSELSAYLSETEVNAGMIDRLKIAYRPYICPFDDLLTLVQARSRIYDIGCGSGQFLLLAAKYTDATALYGIEISKQLISNAKQQFEQQNITVPFHFQTYDGVHFPENLKEANLIFMIDVLHHLPSKTQGLFLENIYHAMQPGAKLVLKDIDAASMLVYCNKLHDLILAKEIGNEISVDGAKAITEKIGFRVESLTYRRMLWYPHFTLLLRK